MTHLIKFLTISTLLTTISSNAETFVLDNGNEIEIVQSENYYSIKKPQNASSFGVFDAALYTKSGDTLYVIWGEQEVEILNFGQYEVLGEMTEGEKAFIDFQKQQGQLEFLAMLTIGKVEFLGESGTKNNGKVL